MKRELTKKKLFSVREVWSYTALGMLIGFMIGMLIAGLQSQQVPVSENIKGCKPPLASFVDDKVYNYFFNATSCSGIVLYNPNNLSDNQTGYICQESREW